MNRALALLVAILFPALSRAQEQPAPVLSAGVSNTWELDWDGINGRTYFLEHSEDLRNWQYIPVIEYGANEPIGYGFASSSDRFFIRLKYTDIPTNDPHGDDFDLDTLSNSAEIFDYYTDPFRSDTDGDGLPDGWEVQFGLDAKDDGSGAGRNGAAGDPDHDGLTNARELNQSTSPRNWDTDGDLLSDGWEVENGLNPNLGTGANGAGGDQDADQFTNFQEMIHGSDPGEADTDGDGVNDGTEVDQGSDPNEDGDGGQAPPPEVMVEIPFSVGDPSGSHSERWQMKIQATGPNDTRAFEFVSPDFGEMGTQNIKLRKGSGYTITIKHIATNIEEGGPDYDWEARVEGMPAGDGDEEENHYFVVGNAWVADNSQGLLTTEKHGDDENISQGRQAFLLPIDLDVVHPASGELDESKEDKDDGGYVSIRRMSDGDDLAPVTKLVVRTISGAQNGWKTRLIFTPGDSYRIYENEARTVEVTSGQTEFDATQGATLYFQGLKKSQSRGAEGIRMQVGINGQWSDGDSVQCTVVQSEFQIQIKAFIPYAWTEAEAGTPFMDGVVAKGDNRTFKNIYSGRDHNYSIASFRLMQKVTLTPYDELHVQGDIQNERNAEAAPLSEHFNKVVSVDPSEQSQTYGFIALAGAATNSGEAEVNLSEYRNLTRQDRESSIDVRIKGEDGALPWWTLDFPHDIEWNLNLKVGVNEDPLRPVIQINGEHDRYPAYEVIVINSIGEFEDVHRHSPLATDHPGPTSLDDDNAVGVEEEDTVND